MAHFSSLLLCFAVFTSLASLSFAACPDFFNAAKVSDFGLSKSTYAAGETLEGSFILANSLDYPLPESVLTLQVARRSAAGFGSDVVGEFALDETFQLAPKASKRISFARNLPQGLPPGEYAVQAFMHSGEFNTGGSTLIEDSSPGATYFTLTDEKPNYAFIDRSSILLSGEPYNPININSLIEQEPGTNISLEFNISNNGAAGDVSLAYKLYVWDAVKHAWLERLLFAGSIPQDSALAGRISSANAIRGSSQLAMSANETRHISFPIGALPSGAYMFDAQLSKGNGRSLLLVRIPVRGGLSGIRFAGVLPFPLIAERPAKVSTCFSVITELGTSSPTSGSPVNAEVRLLLASGTAANGTPVYEDSRVLSLTPAPSDAVFDFTPQEGAGELTLRLMLLTPGGTLMDVSELHYAADNLEQPNVLAVESSVRAGKVTYRISLADAKGQPLAGRVAVTLMDKDNKTVNSLISKITGKMSGEFAAPAGGYVISVRESTYGLAATNANSTPYVLQAPPTTPPAQPPKPPQGPLSSISPFALLFAGVLAVALIALTLYTIKMFKRKPQ
ncbi:MAG: hypothetical protein Q7T16_04685 [Candidatus Burarchaeum sp.]|nr:hypothetical protein [Candidatus Burarchaeum sp.]MDO8339925.1 hypothetical protein [Candidatus Burarchaeum sp.]